MTLCGRRLLLSGLLECYPSFWDGAPAWGQVWSVLVCSLELPLGSLVLFELDCWDRVGLSSEGALSAVSVMCSWKLGRGSWLRLAVWLTGLVALSWSTDALCLLGMCWKREAESHLSDQC